MKQSKPVRIVEITESAINVPALVASVSCAYCGAIVVFLGTVRNTNDGKPVRGMVYEAYPEMALKAFQKIGGDIERKFKVRRYAIVHRIGPLILTDVSVAIVIGSPHRDAAFKAARFVIEAIKTRVPIWKKELYVRGKSAWVKGRRLSS
ncbi:MAG: molybdenum cofactor biosynthesis protein MoaE [bacterium]